MNRRRGHSSDSSAISPAVSSRPPTSLSSDAHTCSSGESSATVTYTPEAVDGGDRDVAVLVGLGCAAEQFRQSADTQVDQLLPFLARDGEQAVEADRAVVCVVLGHRVLPVGADAGGTASTHEPRGSPRPGPGEGRVPVTDHRDTPAAGPAICLHTERHAAPPARESTERSSMTTPEGKGTLEGKVAFVTGAGQGVGQGVAFALAREGASIAVTGRTEAKLVDTVDRIRAIGGTAEPILCDIADTARISAAIETTVEVFGGVDILVNNASLNPLGPLLGLTSELMAKAYASGPIAALHAMQAVYPIMKERGGGNIVNMVSSAAVRWDTSGYGGYASVKEALRSLTRTAASEWGAGQHPGQRRRPPHALSPPDCSGGRRTVRRKPPSSSRAFRCVVSATARTTSDARSRGS